MLCLFLKYVGWLGVIILCFLPWPCSWRVDKGFVVPILLRRGGGDQHLSFTSLDFHFSVNLYIRMIVLCAKTSILLQPAILWEMASPTWRREKTHVSAANVNHLFPSEMGILSFPYIKKKNSCECTVQPTFLIWFRGPTGEPSLFLAKWIFLFPLFTTSKQLVSFDDSHKLFITSYLGSSLKKMLSHIAAGSRQSNVNFLISGTNQISLSS